jgi:hypothetical protein
MELKGRQGKAREGREGTARQGKEIMDIIRILRKEGRIPRKEQTKEQGTGREERDVRQAWNLIPNPVIVGQHDQARRPHEVAVGGEDLFEPAAAVLPFPLHEKGDV